MLGKEASSAPCSPDTPFFYSRRVSRASLQGECALLALEVSPTRRDPRIAAFRSPLRATSSARVRPGQARLSVAPGTGGPGWSHVILARFWWNLAEMCSVLSEYSYHFCQNDMSTFLPPYLLDTAAKINGSLYRGDRGVVCYGVLEYELLFFIKLTHQRRRGTYDH